MSSNKRTLRSSRTTAPLTAPATVIPSPVTFNPSTLTQSQETIQLFAPGSKLPGLTTSDLTLLHKKQRQLEQNSASIVTTLYPSPHIPTALSAILIFAQYEASTAVCIDSSGWLLTCSNCITDNLSKWTAPGDAHKRKWLLYHTGQAVQAECRAWDPICDLALLKIIAMERPISKANEIGIPSFAFMSLSTEPLAPKELIVCIGQPGRDDLEAGGNKRTKYNLVEISEGTFRGMVLGADPHDNSQIGALMHDAWTYWGHSGAPLLRRDDGTLLGLHSSWDDQTAMRHGIPRVAIEEFLKEHLPGDPVAVMGGRRGAGRAEMSNKRKLLDGDGEAGGGGNGLAGEKSGAAFVDLTMSSPG
ncbi:unnamed protein product [Calypogeia fissa]